MSTQKYSQVDFDEGRPSLPLVFDRCQTLPFKAVMEHSLQIPSVAAFLLTASSFRNSSVGANILANFVVCPSTIPLFTDSGLLTPSSCFSLQFSPSLSTSDDNRARSNTFLNSVALFSEELTKTKYIHRSLCELSLPYVTNRIIDILFNNNSNMAETVPSPLYFWPCLRRVSLPGSIINDAVLRHVSNLAALTCLELDGCKLVADGGLRHIAKLTALTSLNFHGCFNLASDHLEHVSKLATTLTRLNLHECKLVSDEGLGHVSKLAHLTDLNLAECRFIKDAGLEHISKLSALTSLNISDCYRITDVGIQRISTNLIALTSLSLTCCQLITDVGLEHISKLLALTSLELAWCHNVSDVGVDHISSLAALTNLNLHGCHRVSDAGLGHLSKLSALTTLDLGSCKNITSAAVDEFLKSLPHCVFNR